MRTELDFIPVFVAAAEAGSFTDAAIKLHLTRSAVSKTISRLEQRLGVVLFHRTTRSRSLTDEGILFYEHCRQALAAISTAETLLDSGKLQASGRLRVSVPALFGHHCVTPLLTEFALEHSGLKLEISFNDRTVDLVGEGFDLAIRIGSLPDSSSLIARKLGAHGMIFCAAPSYLAQHGAPQTIEELSRADAIGYIQSGIVRKWLVRDKKGKLQQITPRAKIMMDDIQAIADAAISGAGIAWLPDWLIRQQIAGGKLAEIMQNVQNITFPVHVIWPQTPRLPLKVRLAVDKLVHQLPARLAFIAASSSERPKR